MKLKIFIVALIFCLVGFLWQKDPPVKYYKNNSKDESLKVAILMYHLKKEFDVYKSTKKMNMEYARNNNIDFVECKFLDKHNQVDDFKVALKEVLSQYDYIIALPPDAVLMPDKSIKDFLIKNREYDAFLEGTHFPHNEYIQPDIFIIKNSNWVREVLERSIAIKDSSYIGYMLPRLSRVSFFNQLDFTFLLSEKDPENTKKRVFITDNELFSMKPDNIIFHPYGYPEELSLHVIEKLNFP